MAFSHPASRTLRVASRSARVPRSVRRSPTCASTSTERISGSRGETGWGASRRRSTRSLSGNRHLNLPVERFTQRVSGWVGDCRSSRVGLAGWASPFPATSTDDWRRRLSLLYAGLGSTPARKSLSRLWVRQIICHSAATRSRPRREKRRKPRASFIWPKTGSTIPLRRR